MRSLHELARQRSLRISRHEWVIGLAAMTAKRGTCIRRQVGCILLDEDGYVLATGYNGVASGQPHCNAAKNILGPTEIKNINHGGSVEHEVFPFACPGAFAQSGTQLDQCHAIHAEQNALLRMGDPRRVHACYVTHSPCITCVKLLMNTACQHIYFLEPYAHDEAARELWTSKGDNFSWNHLTPELLRRLEE